MNLTMKMSKNGVYFIEIACTSMNAIVKDFYPNIEILSRKKQEKSNENVYE